MKRLLFLVPLLTICLSSCHRSDCNAQLPANVTLSKEVLLDKIKGGWAGQAIGCTYGGTTEVKYAGSLIPEYVQIDWNDTIMKLWYEKAPWLYDDVYMDATFV